MPERPERRFNEAEVAAILERATERATEQATVRDEPGRQVVATHEGLTLAQLQDIGREIGIAPDVIAESASGLAAMGREHTRRVVGLPLGVERVVPLQRRLSDEEWERVVVALREVFDARGVMAKEGSLRQWRNGNLQALLEPTEGGQRIRLRTFKGNAPGYMTMGAMFFGAGATGIVAAVMNGATGDAGMMTALAVVAASGAGVLTATVARLFPWARKRREQMAEIAARVSALLPAPPDAAAHLPPPPAAPPPAPSR
jgi:hypothetical protein